MRETIYANLSLTANSCGHRTLVVIKLDFWFEVEILILNESLLVLLLLLLPLVLFSCFGVCVLLKSASYMCNIYFVDYVLLTCCREGDTEGEGS